MVKNNYIPPQIGTVSFCSDQRYLVTTSSFVYEIEKLDAEDGEWLD